MNITRLDDICAEHHPVLESHMSCAWMILQLLLPSSGMAVSPTPPLHPTQLPRYLLMKGAFLVATASKGSPII